MDNTANDFKKDKMAVHVKSRELHIIMSKIVADDTLIPKYYKRPIGYPLTDHTFTIYEDLAAANELDLFNKELAPKRKNYQEHAFMEIVKLLAALRVLYDINTVASDKMQILLTKTVELRRLVRKWIESDEHRLGASLDIIKKDPVDTQFFDKGITAKDLFSDQVKVDFDQLYKTASTAPAPEVHHETKKTLYIPPAPVVPIYHNEPTGPKLTREERIAKIFATRDAIDHVAKVPVAESPEPKSKPTVETKEVKPAEDKKKK